MDSLDLGFMDTGVYAQVRLVLKMKRAALLIFFSYFRHSEKFIYNFNAFISFTYIKKKIYSIDIDSLFHLINRMYYSYLNNVEFCLHLRHDLVMK